MAAKQIRVVITGLGVCAPNGVGIADFEKAIRKGHSGLKHLDELAKLGFRCQVGGIPPVSEAQREKYFSPLERKRLSAQGVIYGAIAALEAWEMAGLPQIPADEDPAWEWGTVFGTGMSGVQTLREAIYKTDEGKVKRLGGAVVEQTMPSGISAFLGGKLGLGNWVTSNSSACSTGTEALIMAADHIRQGRAQIMLAGGCDADGPHVWGGFDAMRVLNSSHNEQPQAASRPMAADAAGFVPGSGGGALVLESLDSALERGVPIWGELAGGYLNSGGQRNGGTMTAPNNQGTQRCIKGALQSAQVEPEAIDLISGHLTSTMGDLREIQNWSAALGLKGSAFPAINALKSMTGHCLSAAGAIECVAATLQLANNFQHPSLNSEELHPQIAPLVNPAKLSQVEVQRELQVVAKSSFGFGDVNSCLILKKVQS